MFILDSLLIGSLRFVLDKIAAAAEAESADEGSLRDQLLEAELRFELGEISSSELARIERELLTRIRELKGTSPGPLTMTSSGANVSGVEATVADELES
jgi:hypothetical protein